MACLLRSLDRSVLKGSIGDAKPPKAVFQAKQRRPGMSRGKWVLMLGVFAAIALAVGAGPAAADLIFGTLTPTPACGPVGTVGSVCAPTETFAFGGDTSTSHGFPGAPGPAAGESHTTFNPA